MRKKKLIGNIIDIVFITAFIALAASSGYVHLMRE